MSVLETGESTLEEMLASLGALRPVIDEVESQRGALHERKVALMVAARDAGGSPASIGRAFGVTGEAVTQAIRRAEARPGGGA